MGLRDALRLTAAASELPPVFDLTEGEHVAPADPWRMLNAVLNAAQADARGATAVVNRRTALQVPAVVAARHLLAATLGPCQLLATDDLGRPLDPQPAWLHSPDPDRTRYSVLADLATTLLLEGVAVWRPLPEGRWRAVDPSRVQTAQDPQTMETQVLVDSRPVPRSWLVFDALPGLLQTGQRALATAWLLEQAARKYAQMDVPASALRNTGPDLSDEEIQALLATWAASRATGGTGYLNAAVELVTYSWSASDLQLVDARAAAATDVARLVGLPAHYLSAPAGDALTYSTVEGARRDLLELHLGRFTACIGQTMERAMPQGQLVRLDTSRLEAADAATRMQVWQAGVAMGAISAAQVARLEPLYPDPDTEQTGGTQL